MIENRKEEEQGGREGRIRFRVVEERCDDDEEEEEAEEEDEEKEYDEEGRGTAREGQFVVDPSEGTVRLRGPLDAERLLELGVYQGLMSREFSPRKGQSVGSHIFLQSREFSGSIPSRA